MRWNAVADDSSVVESQAEAGPVGAETKLETTESRWPEGETVCL